MTTPDKPFLMRYVMSEDETRAWQRGGEERSAIEKKAWDVGSVEILTCQEKRVWIMDAARPIHGVR